VSEIELLAQIGPIDRELARSRFARGDTCYVAYLCGRIAHFAWAQRSGRHWIADAGRTVDVLGGHLWIYHCLTAEWARGHRIYPAVLSHVVRTARLEFREIWIYTTADNVASQRGILRAGFQMLGQLDAFAIGPLTIPTSSRRSVARLIGE
jgi:hypothetical protein